MSNLTPVGAAHARLSPSAAKRWVACPASVRLSEGRESPGSEYAQEGTILHNLSAQLLQQSRVRWASWLGKTFEGLELDQERLDAVRTYVEFVRTTHKALGGEMLVERRVYMPDVHDECWGTSDAILVSADGRTMHVVDAKFGRGIPVSAENNEQMVLYAIGALNLFAGLENVRVVRMSIVQPRLDNTSTVEMLREDLEDWVRRFRAAATLAVGGVLEPPAPRVGEHCKFCPAAAICPAQREQAQALAENVFKVVEAPDVMLVQVLEQADRVEDFLKAVRGEAFKRASEGRLPGYKIVEGRGSREWVEGTNVATVANAVGGISGKEYLTDPVLVSPAKAEEITKANGVDVKVLAPFIRRVPGRPALAKEGDKRPAISIDPIATAQRVFTAIEEDL